MTDFAVPGPQYGTPATSRDTTAVMGRRILAWLLDLALFVAVVGATFAGLAEYVEVPDGLGIDACGQLQDQDPDAASGCVELGDRAYITSAADNGIQTLVSIGYFVVFVVIQGTAGGSPGKLLTGLRVVDERGAKAGVGRSLVRTLLWVVDAAPWFLPLVGFIVGLTSTGHRRIGDLAAKTFVVSRRDVGTPPLATATTAPPPAWGAPAAPSWPSPAPPATPPDAPPPSTSVPNVADLSPDISGVPADRPEPPPVSGTAAPPEWHDPSPEQEPPRPAPPPEARAPADEAAPHVGADPEWWSGPEAAPTPEDAGGAAPVEEPPPITWQDPSPGTDEVRDTLPGWSPPSTPGEDFGNATDDASPTAGPTPFVAPGSDPAAEAPAAEADAPAMPPPQWDPARNTYLQWDPTAQTWLQWDTVANRWKLIDT